MDVLQGKFNAALSFQVHHHIEGKRHDLPDYRSQSGAGYAHGGEAQQTKNKDGVENDVDDGTNTQKQHHFHHPSQGLEDLFKRDLQNLGKGAGNDDVGIAQAHGIGVGVVGEHFQEGTGDEQSHQGVNQGVDKGQKHTGGCGPVGILRILGA